jgi:hypothetical protein
MVSVLKKPASADASLESVFTEEPMHRAPTPTPDHEPFEESEPQPVPVAPSPGQEPVPDHKPTVDTLTFYE